MLKYSKFVNFNTRKSTVGLCERDDVPRHEAISATYVEVVVPDTVEVPLPASIKDLLADPAPANLDEIFCEMLDEQPKSCLHRW